MSGDGGDVDQAAAALAALAVGGGDDDGHDGDDGDDGGALVELHLGRGRTVAARRATLREKSQFFRALYSFNAAASAAAAVDLSCDLAPDVLQWVVRAMGREDALPPIHDCAHAYALLRGAAYLQCAGAEEAVSEYLMSQLDVSNCFWAAVEAHENGCVELFQQIETFVLQRLRTHTYRPASLLDLLRSKIDDFTAALKFDFVDNTLAFFAIFGWVHFLAQERQPYICDLLKCVCIELVPRRAVKASGILEHFPEVKDALSALDRYQELSLQERLWFWKSKSPAKWPRMQVLCSTGYFERKIVCRTSPDGRWHRLTSKPQKLLSKSLGSQMVSVRNSLYFVGGDGNDVLWAYDVVEDKWRQAHPIQTVRIRPAVAVLGSRIFVFGGSNNAGMHDTAECFDTDANAWTLLTPLSTVRSGAATLVHRGKVLLLGGLEKRRQLTLVESYDPDTDEYEAVTDIPRVMADFGACLAGGRAHLVGGFDPLTFNPVSDVLVFDLASGSWSSLPPLSRGKKSSACFYDGVRLHSCGGWHDFATAAAPAGASDGGDASCERFNFERNEWESAAGLPKALQTSVTSTTVDVPVRLMDNFRDYSASNCRVKKVD